MIYFVVSDTHSFYTELVEALNKSGYNKHNKNHTLVIIGDLFDRGDETMELYNYLTSIPEDRLVLIRGNHEILYKTLLCKNFPESHDWSNGTVKTFSHISKIDREQLKWQPYYFYDDSLIKETPYDVWHRMVDEVKNSPVTKFLNSNKWFNYYEIGPYILTHAFIPLKLKTEFDQYKNRPMYYIDDSWLEYDPNWREANQSQWNEATWGCPYKLYQQGCFKAEEDSEKTLVVGHWHTAAFFENINHEKSSKKTSIFWSKGLIAIDGGVQINKDNEMVHKQNVLIIDEKFNCYDKNHRKLNHNF